MPESRRLSVAPPAGCDMLTFGQAALPAARLADLSPGGAPSASACTNPSRILPLPGLMLDDVVELRPARRRLGRRALPATRTRTPPRRLPAGAHGAARSTRPWPRWRRAARTRRADWKIDFALMLGLERVLSEATPHLASGTELRRHQIDALAGMLTELISRTRSSRARPNGNGTPTRRRTARTRTTRTGVARRADGDDDEELERPRRRRPRRGAPVPVPASRPLPARRSRPAGFVEAARTMGVLDPHPPPPAREPVHPRPDRPRVTATRIRWSRSPTGAIRCGATRSRFRPTRGSPGTWARSAGPPTSSSSATRPTRPSARRRARRSAASPSPSTSA